MVQEYILTIVPKFTSFLSILGSTMIISQVLQSRTNRGHTQQRLVCVMSIIDLTVSTAWFLTPLFVTEEMDQFLWGIGNMFSCSLQGFIVQFSISGVLYNASLSLYYLLVIKYGFQRQEMVIIEKYMHAFALLFGITTATTALALNLYEDANWDCWISPTKQTFQWAFFFAPLWIAIIFVITCMFKIYLHVRTAERNSIRWSQVSGRVVRLTKTRAVAQQGALYVGAFFVTWLFPTIARVVKLSGKEPPDWLVALSGSFIPIQGFFNAMVYFRLRFRNCRRANPEKSRVWVVRKIIKRALCGCGVCCCSSTHELTVPDDLDIEPNSSSQNRASAVSAEPGGSIHAEQEFYHRRISLTSLNQGLRSLQSLYVRTSTLFFGRASDGSNNNMPLPKEVTMGQDDKDDNALVQLDYPDDIN